EGDYWTIAYEGSVVRLKDAKGLHYLGQLLRHPGRAFEVVELKMLVADGARLTPGRRAPSVDPGGGDAAERARKAVTNRIRQAVAKGCIRELRRTLGDDRAAPRFIESMGRRGYRFIAPVAAAARPDPGLRTPGVLLVGREAELGQLQRWQEKALGGERQVVFVTGEPGIGKTTVVDAFLQQVAETGAPWIARGWCSEQYGAGEAYLP